MKTKTSKIIETERELFECVYQWGRVGIVADEHCPTFQNFISRIKKEAISHQKQELIDKIRKAEEESGVKPSPEDIISIIKNN